jgi:hypothetical protein
MSTNRMKVAKTAMWMGIVTGTAGLVLLVQFLVRSF